MTTDYYPSKNNPISFSFRYRDALGNQKRTKQIKIPAEKRKSKKAIAGFVKDQKSAYEKLLAVGYPGRLTLDQVYNRYLESQKYNLEKSTITGYNEKYKPHIAPLLGYRMIDEIQKVELDTFLLSLQSDGANKKNGKPLSKKTVKEIRFILASIFDYAKSIKAITENPAENMMKIKKARTQPADSYTIDEMSKIAKSLKDMNIKYRLMLLLFMFYGARREAVLGLTWDEIDFEKKLITFETCVLHDKGYGTYIKEEPKNGKAVTLPISAQVYDTLVEYKQTLEVMGLDNKSNAKGLLFYNYEKDRPMNPDSVNTYFKRFEKKQRGKDAFFPHIKIKKFRTTVASVLVTQGLDIKSIADYIGDDVNTMLRYYAKQVSPKSVDLMETLEGAYGNVN